MRNSRTLFAVLLSAALASTSALAGIQYGHNSDDDFSWSNDGHSVSMHSNDRSGVVVGETWPTPFHGLQSGDVILSIDNRRLARVGELLQALRDHGPSPATLRIRRAGAEVTVSWTHAECQALNPWSPPPPPPPPPHS